MLSKEEAINLLKENLTNKNLIKHCIAVGAIMKELAIKLGEEPQRWELVGLLHDIDYEKASMEEHGLKSAEMLNGLLDEESLEAIRRHNYENNGSPKPESKMDKALIAADAVSGLVVATALVMPNKKLDEVKVESLLKKFKQKDFARRVNRENIKMCEELGFSLEEFLELSLEALKKVSDELGL